MVGDVSEMVSAAVAVVLLIISRRGGRTPPGGGPGTATATYQARIGRAAQLTVGSLRLTMPMAASRYRNRGSDPLAEVLASSDGRPAISATPIDGHHGCVLPVSAHAIKQHHTHQYRTAPRSGAPRRWRTCAPRVLPANGSAPASTPSHQPVPAGRYPRSRRPRSSGDRATVS
jgi:hypothetical protein